MLFRSSGVVGESVNGYGGKFVGSTSNATPLVATDGVNDLFVVKYAGNVGIGTNTPTKKLDIYNSGTTSTDFIIRNGTVSLLEFVDSGAAYVGSNTNHPLLLTVNGSERLRIDTDGDVGIGTTSPTTKLDINNDKFRVRTAKTPASATAAGDAGDICWDSNYVYKIGRAHV